MTMHKASKRKREIFSGNAHGNILSQKNKGEVNTRF